MDESTLFLSKLIGPIMLLIGVSLIFRQDVYKDVMKHLSKDRSLLLYNGIVESTAGLALVLNHNLWGSPAEIIISIVAWGMLVEGAFELFVSKKTIKEMAHASTLFLNISGVITMGLGAYLAYPAYFLY